jgi:catechol 2,3-dioxygenase-like lactoylglutathione lyase family enzyme
MRDHRICDGGVNPAFCTDQNSESNSKWKPGYNAVTRTNEGATMATKERPPIWIGHVTLETDDLDASETFMKQVGLRAIFRGDDVAVLELRGGTHIVLLPGDGNAGRDAAFDFMVEDVDRAHADMTAQGFPTTDIERGDIHDSFFVIEPGGNRIKVNSSHVPDHDAV